MKRLLTIALAASLICPVLGIGGCSSQSTKPAANAFSFPKFNKDEKSVRKNTENPATVGEFLAMPR
ncbi:MAG: hypothetical protein LBT89_11150 [Planctomycetaceae bacterium]|jgi:hypothetical protein|nr:hypothetical protein [Planctomycetaceae bacterium]